MKVFGQQLKEFVEKSMKNKKLKTLIQPFSKDCGFGARGRFWFWNQPFHGRVRGSGVGGRPFTTKVPVSASLFSTTLAPPPPKGRLCCLSSVWGTSFAVQEDLAGVDLRCMGSGYCDKRLPSICSGTSSSTFLSEIFVCVPSGIQPYWMGFSFFWTRLW